MQPSLVGPCFSLFINTSDKFQIEGEKYVHMYVEIISFPEAAITNDDNYVS